jgi:hypothetical protein
MAEKLFYYLLVLTLAGGRPVFTDRDWRFLFAHPHEKVFTARLRLRFAMLWLVVVLIGLSIVFYVMSLGLGWSVAEVLLGIAGILLIAPKWLG